MGLEESIQAWSWNSMHVILLNKFVALHNSSMRKGDDVLLLKFSFLFSFWPVLAQCIFFCAFSQNFLIIQMTGLPPLSYDFQG